MKIKDFIGVLDANYRLNVGYERVDKHGNLLFASLFVAYKESRIWDNANLREVYIKRIKLNSGGNCDIILVLKE